MRRLLDDGHAIEDTQHRLVDPHYLRPDELRAIQRQLEGLLKTDFKDDEWSSNEIQGFIDACVACVSNGTALVVTLD